MDPKIWGHSLWQSLIHIAQVYPNNPTPEQKAKYKIFYYSLGYVIPCYACQKNYKSHLKRLPIRLENRQALLHWLHQVHNMTLKQINRSDMSYQSFMSKYTKSQSSKRMIILLILVGILVGLYYFVYKKRSPIFFLRR